MKTKKWLEHAILTCYMCDWECQDYLIAQREARKHVKKTTHEVHGEFGYAVEIDA